MNKKSTSFLFILCMIFILFYPVHLIWGAAPFCWYGTGVTDDKINQNVGGATFNFWYDYDDDGAATGSWVNCSVNETGITWNGTTRALRANYQIQGGGYAGGGMHIENGLALSNNFLDGDYLRFYYKGTGGGEYFYIRLTDASGNEGASVRVDDLDINWTLVQIPLTSFTDNNMFYYERIERVKFEFAPTGTERTFYIDEIWFAPYTNVLMIVISNEQVLPSVITNNTNRTVIFSLNTSSTGATITNVSLDLTPISGSIVKMSNISGDFFRYAYTVPQGASPGDKTFNVTVYDSVGKIKSTSITLTVEQDMPAGSFCWYGSGVDDDGINHDVLGGTFRYWYDYDNDGAATNSRVIASVDEATNTWNSTAKSLKASYRITGGGGYAGGGMHIENGIPLSNSFISGDYLTFYVKGGSGNGERFVVRLCDAGNQEGPTVLVDDFSTSEWKYIQIPLSSFTNANVQYNEKIRRVKFEFSPADNTAHTFYVDEIWFRPYVDVPASDIAAPQITSVNVVGIDNVNNQIRPKETDIKITAYLTDIDSVNLSITDIEADIHNITGNAGDTAVNPDSVVKNGNNYTATWLNVQVGDIPFGTYNITINAKDPNNNKATAYNLQVNVSVELSTDTENRIESPSGRISLNLPPNSLPQPVTPSISEKDAEEGILGTGEKSGEKPLVYFEIEVKDKNNKKIKTLKLKKSGTLEVDYSSESAKTSGLAIYYYDGVRWVKLGGKIDSQNLKISISVKDVKEKYAVFECEVPTEKKLYWVDAEGMFTPNDDGIYDKLGFYFDNPEGEKVSLKIFSLKGKLIKTIDDLLSGEGWDGTNDDGKETKGGAYIYQLKIGDKAFSGTTILVK